MSLTVAAIITNLDTYIGDTSTDRVSAAERLQYVTEATVWLKEQLQNDHEIKTYSLSFIDTVNYYKVTSILSDLLEGADLRRRVGQNYISMAHKSSRELAEDIAQGLNGDDAWAIERRDRQIFVVINAQPIDTALQIESFDTEAGIDFWDADTTTSDAVIGTTALDEVHYNEGSGAMNFDITVAQHANNRATFSTTDDYDLDLSSYEGQGVFLLDVDLPTVDTIASFTFYWGNSDSVYWSKTVTTDLDGSAFAAGWNTLAFEWASATQTGTVDETAITYFRIDMNYGAGQVDETDYHYDNLRIANSEELVFHYVSWDLGTDTTGATDRLAFSATTDIPFFSGQYDQYKYAVAHMAASVAFRSLRLFNEAASEEKLAYDALKRVRSIFPSSVTKEIKSFKVQGLNLNK